MTEKKEKPFTILFCKGWNPNKGLNDRGGFGTLLRAYCKAFVKSDNVKLIAKLNQAYISPGADLQKAIINMGIDLNMCPRLEIITQNIPYEGLRDIYAQANVSCIPTKGEAFGLTFAESMAMGVPCVSSDFGGQCDFINNSNGWLLKTKLGPAVEDSLFYEGAFWGFSDEEELTKLLIHLYNHRDEIKAKAEQAKKDIQRFTWENSAEKALLALDKLN